MGHIEWKIELLIPAVEVFLVFLRLGLTSFGGPVAHLGYFHREFVEKMKWISDHEYADLVALCQFLPGPASSQVGMAIGLKRAGYAGALAAWVGFTFPSAIMLILFGLGISHFQLGTSWLHGLKIVAVAIVAQAIWSMAIKLCPDKERVLIAVLASCVSLIMPSALSQLVVLVVGGILGIFIFRGSLDMPERSMGTLVRARDGVIFLLAFFVLLLFLPIAAKLFGTQSLQLFDSFYRTGSLVFGGGHVVLPLLQMEVVPKGWVSNEIFMAGYGAAQAVPGPLFSFAAYLGAVSSVPPSGWLGAMICLVALFLPSFLLIVGIQPFWERIRQYHRVRFAMAGLNAAVVGLLVAAFYNPVWTSAIFSFKDFALAVIYFILLVRWKFPSWLVVILGATLGALSI